MTNKKFKLAAMSLALTACVAASPLAANAETGAEATSSAPAVETPAPAAEPSAENAPATNESKQNTTDETKQESTDEAKQESTDESKKESTDESKKESTDESKQESTDESKQESTDEAKQESTGESKQEAADKNEQNAAVENKALAAAPVAKAPVLMTAALAKAPAAPATPMEEDTVATITGQDGTTTQYKSFDEAVSKANNGDTIEVIKDATSTGIDLQNKKLTIKGKTVTTTTDSGTEEKATVKPKLKFVAKEGQSQIAGITLWGSDLTFQNMDVDMTGASSTTYNKWNAVCMSDNASLTLNRTDLSMDGTGLDASAQGIYMAGRGRNELNVEDHSTLTINNYYNAIAWDGVGKGNEGSTYFINITDGSTFKAEGNGAGIVGLESLDVLVDNSTLTITDCTERSGINGADVKIVNGSTANISGNHEGYGIHANDLLVENSTLTANNNGYGGIRITGKGEFTNSTVTVTGTENKGNASVEITVNKNEHKDKDKYLVGSLDVRNSTLNISDNNATGIACRNRFSCPTSLTIDDASRVTIQNNNATPKNGYNPKGDSTGGGLRIEEGSTAVLGRNTVINNNTAKSGGGVYTKGGKVTINKSTITENKATGNGGGICAEDNSTVTVVGGEISSNEAAGTNRTTSGGGGIFANKGSTVKLNDTTVSENKVTGDYGSGGGVRVDGGKLTVDNAKILDNATNNNGGGISVKDSELSVTDSQITGNNAWNKVTVGERIFVNGNGGGIEIIGSDSDTKEHTITNTQITQNTTGLRGGGVYAEKASLTITKSTLDGNKALDTVGPQASSEGGGLSVRGGTNITLDSTTVTNNSAKDGGGIWVRSDVDTSVSIKNGTTISNNQSVYGGGGVMIRQELGKKINVTIEDAKIETNAAENGGGIYLLNQVDLQLKNITVSGNTAKNVGGGIFGQDGTKLHADNLTVSNNTAASGGGVYLWNTGNSIILAELLNSFVDHNIASSSGGGIFAYNGVQINANNTSISNNKSKSGGAIWMNASDAELTGNTIIHNTATGNGGGIYGEQRSTIDLRTGALYNNHAGTAGDDIYLNNTTLILRPVGDDWILDDCGHPIDGWYLDGKDARWDADSQKKFVTNLDALLEGTDYEIEKGEDGSYIITIGSNALALKAAHNAPSEPKPDPDGPDTPNPNPDPKPEPKPGPDTSITPEDPQLPPVQDARADTPDSTVLPANPTNPAVQDAHALPQTGTSLFAALAMALSGFALTIAGAWASLLGKNSRH
ncbi:MAG: hypothetical protein KH145_08430 [Faecalibacterium prausnitzii]|nr:hypothetical protein [Faecalibacterium prausnitzii]